MIRIGVWTQELTKEFFTVGVRVIECYCLLQVKVIVGEERECTGTLLSIDGNDGVVKLDRGKIQMLQLSYLCRMPHDTDWGDSFTKEIQQIDCVEFPRIGWSGYLVSLAHNADRPTLRIVSEGFSTWPLWKWYPVLLFSRECFSSFVQNDGTFPWFNGARTSGKKSGTVPSKVGWLAGLIMCRSP